MLLWRRPRTRWRSRACFEGHVGRVVVANTKKLRQISEAKAKTDRLDARTLACVLASGFLDVVWLPDEAARALRRWFARRSQLVRQRTRAKNEIHAVLVRTLTVGPGVSDLFGKAGRAWLTQVELPVDERVTIGGCCARSPLSTPRSCSWSARSPSRRSAPRRSAGCSPCPAST